MTESTSAAELAQEFFAAARELALHTGTLQERLVDAYADHLLAVTLRDLPADLQPIFAELEERLNRPAGDDDDDPFGAAAAELSDSDARQLIDRILVLYARLVAAAQAR
jgi:hypothetical protein